MSSDALQGELADKVIDAGWRMVAGYPYCAECCAAIDALSE